MVVGEDEEVFGVLDFVRNEEANCLEGLLSSVLIGPSMWLDGFSWPVNNQTLVE